MVLLIRTGRHRVITRLAFFSTQGKSTHIDDPAFWVAATSAFIFTLAVGLTEWTTSSDEEVHDEVTQREGFEDKASDTEMS